MGDVILLLMAVEKTFEVEIPDNEAEQMRTVGHLMDWLSSRLHQRITPLETAPCLNVYTYNRVRHALHSSVKVRPQTQLEDLLPLPKSRHLRREQWNQLNARGLQIPPLEWAPRVKITLETLWFAAAAVSSIPVIFIAFSLPFAHSPLFWWLPIAFGFVLYFLVLSAITKGVHRLLRSFKIYSPLLTVGAIARYLATEHYWQMASARGSWSESEAWRVLQKLVAREAEVELNEVRYDTPFIELLFWD